MLKFSGSLLSETALPTNVGCNNRKTQYYDYPLVYIRQVGKKTMYAYSPIKILNNAKKNHLSSLRRTQCKKSAILRFI